jgi:hypothetical protein
MRSTFSLVVGLLNILVTTTFLFLFLSGRIEIRTKKVVVIDENGVERVHLDGNSSKVRVFGKEYKRRSSGAGLILFNTKGDEVGGIGALRDGTVSLTLDSYDYDNKKISERISMYVMEGDKPGFLIKDINNVERFKMQLNPNNTLDIQVFDIKGEKSKFFSF